MDNRHIELSKYRLDEAKNCINTAESNISIGDYKSAANRSYYAMFHCVRAVLALDEVDFKKHMQVIGYFRKEYIKSGVMKTVFSDYLGNAFEVRGKSDYEDFYMISKKDVEQQVNNAKEFYEAVELYLADKWNMEPIA